MTRTNCQFCCCGISFTIAFASGAILVFCGIFVAREYISTKDFAVAECITTGSRSEGYRECKGDDGDDDTYTSSYPCIQILVNYTKSDSNEINEGIIYSSGVQAHRDDGMCSAYSCFEHPKKNEIKLEQYKDKWMASVSTPYTCYYSQEEPEKLVKEIKFTREEVLHAMIWPSIICTISIIASVVSFIRL